MKGNVAKKIQNRGFGFILGKDRKEYFFHMSALLNCSWDNIEEGDAVTFNNIERSGKLVAYKVEKYYGDYETSDIREKIYAGIHPMVKMDSFSKEEKKIIKTLGNVFYVTNSGEKIILGASSEYRYCLVKPTDFFSEQFNLKREIVVIFAEYEHFEPRTFDAISEVYKRNQQHFRIDRICSLIISKDDGVEEEIHHILKNDTEMQVVIPFRYSELQGGDCKTLIVKRFREYFYERDLFAFESPLKKDIYFFGRREYVHELISRHNSGENSGVFGLRRSGKTSVLQAIERAAQFTETVCVFVDCQDLYHYSWNIALFTIISLVNNKMGSLIDINKNVYTEDEANSQFALDLEEIIDKSKKDLLLLFDEIEQITPKLGMKENWRDGDDFVKFWQTIRSNFHKWGNRFTFILAGTNPSAIEQISINKHDNPLYNQLKAESYLPPFKVSDTKDMVNKLGGYMGMIFDDVVCAKLTQDFGGHPYLMRHFCSTINQYINENKLSKPITISLAIYNKVMPIFVEKSADNYCRFILKVLEDYYPEENMFLQKLALGNLNESDMYDPQMVAHLLGYGIIESNQGLLEFKVEVLKNYLSRKYSYKRQNLTNEEKWAEISERRNRLEIKLRTIVKMQLKVKYGTNAKQKVLDSMRPDLKVKYHNLQYNDLFDPKKCEIYFNQLGNLIDKHWDACFKNIFSKNIATITAFFTIINDLRLECHTSPVTDEEMDNFRGTVTQLEKEVSNWLS